MDPVTRKRALLSATLVIIAILAYSSVLDRALDWIPATRTISRESEEYLDDWTKKSIATFAVSKTINAALSVVEDSEVELAVFNVAAGELVRPLNDMVARVSAVALAGAVSLGIQRLLIEIGASIGFRWFLTIAMVLMLVNVWVHWVPVRRLAYGLLVLALAARLLVPVAVYATGRIGDEFTADAQAKAQGELELLKTEVKQADNLSSAAEDSSLWDKLRRPLQEAQRSVNRLGKRFATMADAYTEAAVTLIVVFVFQTMLMPIMILWGLTKLLGYLLGAGASAVPEANLWAPVRRSAGAGRGPVQVSDAAPEAQG